MGAMNDLDRELARALRVDPSADFTARVRTRIASEPRPTRWSASPLAWSAIGCTVVVMSAIGLWSWQSEPVRPEAAMPSLVHQALASVPVPLSAAVARSSPRLSGSRVTQAAGAPDVQVSPSEMQALQRLFAGGIMAPQAELPDRDELSIVPLNIEAISIPTLVEGERK